MEFTVQTDGSCSNLQVTETSGFAMLDEAALHAVQDWKYKPATISTPERIRFVFKLDR